MILTPRVAAGIRVEWQDLPAHVRAAVEARLGSPVVRAYNQAGGFSPGLAARVTCADGSRAFVKAVGTALSQKSLMMYRQEALISRQLPPGTPVPALRSMYDDRDWVALIFDEIDGRMPHTPWQDNELHRVVDAVTHLTRNLTPCPIADLQPAHMAIQDEMLCYRAVCRSPRRSRPMGATPPERAGRAGRVGAEARRRRQPRPLDLRADNILLTDDRVWFVDWPWVFRGAAWIDSVMLIMSTAAHGIDPEAYLVNHPLVSGVDPTHVTGLVAGLTGYLAADSRRPAPPGLPTLRAFQRAQHRATLTWLRRRTSWT